MSAHEPIKRKLVIVGDGACGKTCLLTVFHRGRFPHVPTVFEHFVAELRIDGRYVSLSLWDTAGQEEYERLRPMAYPHSNVVLIAYAIDSPDSLDNVTSKWIDEVRRECPGCPVILVGCKRDLREERLTRGESIEQFVTAEQGAEVAKQIGAKRHIECSALTGYHVDKVFEHATRAALFSGALGYSKDRVPKKDAAHKTHVRSGSQDNTTNCCVIL
ncbi:GTP-binding protein rhoA [Syncephalis pseudoplumigaleata]|uniref:GTP-binding protein rhoA n=1 Tax=Syncephalis pseudoplumigaleata TaxID=1712513 RepID=A0A4P9YVW0_9FUNG|nr:GTP-binding protein rhoA [Syncephalis pseudoplumigaleata]|eukprot:RKP24147.1 GTP-binding protein rhoA [Syncephalis pseudoplumigaleata]